jgi:hypothetical protein
MHLSQGKQGTNRAATKLLEIHVFLKGTQTRLCNFYLNPAKAATSYKYPEYKKVIVLSIDEPKPKVFAAIRNSSHY